MVSSARQKRGKSHHDLRDETRNLVLASARELFVENGYARSTMQMIAEKAGVSRSSLYRHFENKWEVAKPIIESIWPTWETMWGDAPVQRDATLDEIARWLRSMLDLLHPARGYVFLVREIEAIEPEASKITMEVRKKILDIISRNNGDEFLPSSDTSDCAYFFDQMFLLQIDQFIYSSLRMPWDTGIEAPINAMARHMKAFLGGRTVSPGKG